MQELDARIDAQGPSVGGALCLDFANTVEPRGGTPDTDLSTVPDLRDDLNDGYDLVAWGFRQGLYDRPRAAELWHLVESTDLLSRALTLRDAVYRVFTSLVVGTAPAAGDVAVLRTSSAEALAAATWQPRVGGLDLSWPDPDPGVVLGQVGLSALDLLRDPASARIKLCPGFGRGGTSCGWLFLDTTKNRSRRWCSMSDCGNVSKSQRQSRRRQDQRASR
ncbi:CGNR zinc finger domain-containing protein [Tenggerimyces flavus]|nr:ABATE domain-containing protein [Tenggerimyces flavus]MBM7785918.1 putative RNA-binding Zn ribbon-like protein [Tenggerimyces flavus]